MAEAASSQGSAPRHAAFGRWRRWAARYARDPQFWRLSSGLVLFAFALTHFLNHALGHVSIEAMDAMQAARRAVWRSWPGTVLLYGALATHMGFALARIIARRTWRMAPWEAVQMGLGLAIPVLGAAHVAATRGLNAFHGVDDTYAVQLRLLWPGLALDQSILIMVVWLHSVVGLHFWLRVKPWYAAWSPALMVLAALVPTLAITGWIEGARRVALMSFAAPPLTDEQFAAGGRLIEGLKSAVWWALGGAAAALLGAQLWRWRAAGLTIRYADGRSVRARPGATLLEISRAAGVPHAAVCGGRGRCSTCRVAVQAGLESLPPPNPVEAAALARIHAPPSVRLACQIRPTRPLTVRPLLRLREDAQGPADDVYRWGVERRITVLFSDLRGFTTLAERLYPYDAVFLLNRYFELMSEAVERHGGEVDKFLGDGVMALFGTARRGGSGAREALHAARDMLAALDQLNDEFDATLSERLRMGIGLHTGPAVLGRVGGQASGLTALGDTVNIASRLEALNKELGSAVVVSEATLATAKLRIGGATARDIPLRGRSDTLRVWASPSLDDLHEAEAAPAARDRGAASAAPT